jgi:hypothetical protein
VTRDGCKIFLIFFIPAAVCTVGWGISNIANIFGTDVKLPPQRMSR